MHTRNLAIIVPLIALTGCASTVGGRAGLPDRWRTIASANGKSLPVETGPPGAEVAAELEAPEPKDRAEGRISGRVVDENGRPVPSAGVRLADGPARAGRDVRDVTDAAGGFTLKGLRPGDSYTLIAELDDGQNLLVGRSRVEAPDSGVRIRLRDPEVADAEPPPRQDRRRVGRASSREELDSKESQEPETPRRASRVNAADLPPAEEAEALKLPEVEDSPQPGRSAWRPDSARTDPAVKPTQAPPGPSPSAQPEPALPDAKPSASEPEPAPPEPRTDTSATAVEDEGPNPLPPARERPIEPKTGPEPAPAVPVEPSGDPLQPPSALPPPDVAPSAEPTPDPKAETPAPPESDEPAPVPDPSAASPPAGAPEEKPTASAPIPAESAPRRRPTWRELIEQEAPARVASSIPISTRRLPPPLGDPGGSRFRGLGLWGGSAREVQAQDDAITPASCRFDSKKQQLVDFRLPNLDGKSVRLQDFDADFVLLDFWGTWCKPCRESIPRLVELQTRYGPKRLRVVGVATENGSPDEQTRGVDEVARSMGINYPLLMSGLDGKPCPLQEALHIQAYPTMILLDRKGEILWRGTGAEVSTLARLDRVIAARAEASVVRR